MLRGSKIVNRAYITALSGAYRVPQRSMTRIMFAESHHSDTDGLLFGDGSDMVRKSI